MRFKALIISSLVLLSLTIACQKDAADPIGPTPNPIQSDIEYWLTTPDKNVLFSKINLDVQFKDTTNSLPTIEVDTTQRFQSMEGFGYALTGGSALVINNLPSAIRSALLDELFLTDSVSIGVSYLRVSIGASDLDASVFSYNDVSPGQTDTALNAFSIAKDKINLIPVLKEILVRAPDIKILGSPWSAPAWMKDNGSAYGGSLKPEFYGSYAQYFVKYIKAMEAEGVTIDAITPQNEPLNAFNNPSMFMSAEAQREFIKFHLGPAFVAAGITTKIIIYDHNADVPEYPITILDDPEAAKYIDGSAFHLYLGDISALSVVHNAHPDKHLYFTEQYTASTGEFRQDLNWHIKHLIVGASRNWSRNVIEWNLASDENFEPHTQGGCTVCQGALTIQGATVKRNVSYYIIAHAAKFVRPGSVRISSNTPGPLVNIAFQRPDNKKVLIVLNDSEENREFNISFNGKIVTVALIGGAVGTYVW